VNGSASARGAEARTVATNALYRGGSVVIEKGARFLLIVGAAPVLGEAAFGGYQFALAVTAMCALGADLGLSVWTTRAIARERGRAGVIVGTVLRLRAAAAGLCLLAVGAATALSPPGPARDAMALLGVAALANAFVDYYGAVLRGFERLRDEAVLNVSRALLVTGGGLVALHAHRSLTAFAAGLLAGTVASAAVGTVFLGRRLRGAIGPARLEHDRALARQALAEALPMGATTLLSLVFFKLDVVVVRALSGEAELGAYSAAYKVFEAALVLPSVVMAAAFSPLARAHRDPGRRQRWEVALASLLLGTGALVGATLWLGGARIVAALFGAGFVRAVPSLSILGAAVPLMFLNAGLTPILIARGLERSNLVLAAGLVAVNLAANLALVPRWGGPGAALATLVTEVARAVGCLAVLLRPASRPPPGSPASLAEPS
jgi:O-antigen/teichoic acid export membrane protein